MSPTPAPAPSFAELANAIRALSMDAVERAKSGHPGMPMGMADVATVLFTEFLNYDPKHPHWPNRDRFVLSAGHGSMLIYSLLYLTGYADMTLEEIKNFRQLGAKTAGHPEFGHAAGIETTTGPLGQGLANAVGMALAERMRNARFGGITHHFTYAIAGDGCLMEGLSHEAMALAGHLKLNKLIVLWDDNGITIDGKTDLCTSEDVPMRARAYGWNTIAIDGHDASAIRRAITEAQKSDKPTLIACKTTIGYGAPTKAGTSATHGSPLGTEEVKGTREKLGWPHAPFEIPEHILQGWRNAAKARASAFTTWTAQYDTVEASTRAEFERTLSGDLPDSWVSAFEDFKKQLAEKQPNEATRKASENALNVLTKAIPEMIGGSADLTGSNNTKTVSLQQLTAQNYKGGYIYYGIREHAMGAVMNGIALYGGFIPFGGTFLVFSDYMRPAMRLSALMQQRVIYVLTHDSIGLGEDGPTHQPVEHLAALRAIPNLNVFRPADSTETAECWALTLSYKATPSVLSLTRQNLPSVRKEYTKENLCARGGYVLSPSPSGRGQGEGTSPEQALTLTLSQGERDVTLIASGSEVSIALDAQKLLGEKGISARVVSMPCFELFAAQPQSYRNEVLGTDTLKVGIEAAFRMGWDSVIGMDGVFIGMQGFGASAPAPDLYKHFGITAEAVVEAVLRSSQDVLP